MVGEDQSPQNLLYSQLLFITTDMPLGLLWPEEYEVDNINYASIQELNSFNEN